MAYSKERKASNDDSFFRVEMTTDDCMAPLVSQDDASSELHWTRRHALLIKRIFASLEERGLKYVVIRNDEELPDYNKSKDVDILIDPHRSKQARNLVLSHFKEFGIKRLVEYRFGNIVCLYGIDVGSNFSIHVDLISGYAPKGFCPLSFEEIYEHRKRANGFWALNQQFGAAFLLIYKIFGYSRPSFKKNYVLDMQRAQDSGPKDFYGILNKFLGNSLAETLTDAIKRGSIADIIGTKRNLDWRLRFRSLKLSPFATLARPPVVFLKRFLSLKRKMLRSASSVALLGGHFQDIDNLKDGLRRQLGKTFVRDGREFVEIYEIGEASAPDRRGAGHIYEVFANIKRNINAARSDRVIINLFLPETSAHDAFEERNTPTMQMLSLLLLPKYLIRVQQTHVEYYKKSYRLLIPRYVLVGSECSQCDIDNAQISHFVMKFFLQKLSKPIFGF